MTTLLKKTDKLLVEKATAKAGRTGDDWNFFRYKNMDAKNLTTAERYDLNAYLFGSTWGTLEQLEALP